MPRRVVTSLHTASPRSEIAVLDALNFIDELDGSSYTVPRSTTQSGKKLRVHQVG
jgi:hypothetical protein